MSRRKDDDGLDLKPHKLDSGRAWFYEDRLGIDLYSQMQNGSATVVRVFIPFRSLVGPLRRIAKARGVRL